MEITSIKRCFELLSKANNEPFVTIKEFSKELGISKTQLMGFIEENNKLFRIGAYQHHKKNYGMCVFDVYESPEDNPITIEHANMLKDKYKNTVWLTPILDWGWIKGFQVIASTSDTELHEDIWKNSKEKIEILNTEGLIGTIELTIGSMCEASLRTYNNATEISDPDEVIEKFKNAGWNVAIYY